MTNNDSEDKDQFTVVMNHEEQYSIWPVGRNIPIGWKSVGKSGSKAACLEFIDQVWTDMRPLSLREKMLTENEPASSNQQAPQESLIDYLSSGDQPVEVHLGRDKDLNRLADRIESGMVQLRFTGTQGESLISLSVDSEASTKPADIRSMVDAPSIEAEAIQIAGQLTLDGVRVHCSVQVEPMTLTGVGSVRR